jgi:predicted Rdx family selenoprotein
MKTFKSALLFLLILCVGAYGQTTDSYIPKIVPPSPQAASLTRYVDIPVSYYTGTANISVPIYTAQEGKVSLPISISYHPSGIKVADEASQVGLGWALNAGGVISRTVMGEDDFTLSRYFSPADNLPTNYFPTANMQMGADIANNQSAFNFNFYSQQDGGPKTVSLKVEESTNNEYQPDIYNFNFAGYSGKFIISRTKEIIMNEKSDIRIKMIEANNGADISWEIKTPDGTAYLFNQKETFRNAGGGNSVSSWYLTQITSPEGSAISLSYNTINDAFNYPQGAITETLGIHSIGATCNSGENPTPVLTHTIGRIPPRYISTVYLNEITFQNGSVKFIFENREDLSYDKKLKTVEIYNKPGGVKTLLKAFDFNYAYFDGTADIDVPATSDGSGSVSKRLKLLSVTEKSASGSALKPHVFDYFESSTGYSDLPAKTSFAQDHWGYYNGKQGTTSLIPTFSPFSSSSANIKEIFGQLTGTERDTGPDYIKAFSLKKITYPTGGNTEFDFEAHDYDVNNSNKNDHSFAGSNMGTPVEKYVSLLYNKNQPGVSQDFEVDFSSAVAVATAQGGLTTTLKLSAFVRLSDSTPCSAISSQTNKVYFELIERATGISVGRYDMFAMQECTGNSNSSTSPCINKGCVAKTDGTMATMLVSHDNTIYNITPGKYIWRAIASNGNGVLISDFGISFSWFEPLEATEGSMKNGGGLRVKTITVNDGVRSNVKTFKYRLTQTGSNGQSIEKSTGRLMTKPQYTYGEDRSCVGSGPGGTDYRSSLLILRTSNSIIPLSASAGGSVVGYDQVVVSYGAGGENGQSIFYYDNQSDVVNNFSYYRPPLISSKPFKSNGNLLKQEDFVKSGSGFVKVKEVEYDYYLSTPTYQYAAEVRNIPFPAAGVVGYIKKHGFFYPAMIKNWNYLKSEKTKVYDLNNPGTPIETVKEYFYNNTNYTQLSQSKASDSRGRNIVTSYKYPFDYSTGVYPAMVTKNMVSPIIEETRSIENGATLTWVNTEYFNFNPSGSLYLPMKVDTKIGQGPAFNLVEFLTYDDRGNLLTFKEKGGATTKLEYYGLTDVGKTDLLKAKTEADGTTVTATTTYNYKSLVGVESITDPSGKVTWYNYDNFSRLSDIRENNSGGNLLKSFHYNYANQPGWSNGITDDPAVDVPSSPGLVSEKYSRVLIVGNSITKLIAQASPDGWRSDALIAEGGWGRASSTKDKDFVHILEKRFRDINPDVQVLPLWEAPFERDYPSGGIAGWLTFNYTDFQNRIISGFGGPGNKPDLIIIRLGENVNNTDVNPQNFKEAFKTLIDKILAVSTPGAKVIVTNSMWPDQPLANTKIQEVATERSLPFVDLSDMSANDVYKAGKDPVSMAAFPNNTGDTHPGDAGMLEIADRIWSKVRNVELASNIGGNVSKVRFYPRTDCCMDHIVGSVIQGSNDISNANGWTTLATINKMPTSGWNEYFIRTTTAWRYLRFLAGPNCSGELIELEFYNGSSKLTGATFGSAGYGVVFDSQMINFWQGTAPGPQNYAGLDLGVGCSALTASVLSPANNASLVGTASTTTANRVTTAISVTTCVPTGTTINSVEIWAATSDGGWPNRMGYAVADASQTGVYKLSSVEGSANGQWPTPYLGPGTYRFYAIVKTATSTVTTDYITVTLTAPPVTGCPVLTASVLSPANNASVVGTASTTTANRVTTAISVTTCVPTGSTINSVEIWATTIDGGFPNRMGYAVADAGQPGVYKLSSVEGSANGQWPIPYLGPGTYRFYAIVKTATSTVTTDYITVTLTAPPVTGCPVLTASVLSPANNASVVGTASTTTANRVTTAISVTTCVPTGSTINSVEIWATTSDGGFPNRMGYAVADAGQPGVYKLSSVEGSANGQWSIPYLGPGTYRFYAIVKTAASTVTTDYVTVTLTAAPVTGCPALTASVLSPANNASVVGTASTTTANRVTTAISVMTCVPAGSTISSVEIWAATSDGGWPNRMGYAVADASQPGVYKLSSVEGSANGQWPTPYLGPGTYRFYAIVNTGTASVTTGYNTITLTAPASTSCPALTGSVLSPANNASVVGTASTTTANRVTTAISVRTCVPAGSIISSVEVWAATSDGGWPNRMGYAVADASQPGVYKLSSVEGNANGQWPTPYLGPGTYRFYAIVNTGTASFTTGYNTITLTAP